MLWSLVVQYTWVRKAFSAGLHLPYRPALNPFRTRVCSTTGLHREKEQKITAMQWTWSVTLRQRIAQLIRQEIRTYVECYNYNIQLYLETLKAADKYFDGEFTKLMTFYEKSVLCVGHALVNREMDHYHVKRLCDLLVSALCIYRESLFRILDDTCRYLTLFEIVATIHGWELVRVLSFFNPSSSMSELAPETTEALVQAKLQQQLRLLQLLHPSASSTTAAAAIVSSSAHIFQPLLCSIHTYGNSLREAILDPLIRQMINTLRDISWLEEYIFYTSPLVSSSSSSSRLRDRLLPLKFRITRLDINKDFYRQDNKWRWRECPRAKSI